MNVCLPEPRAAALQLLGAQCVLIRTYAVCQSLEFERVQSGFAFERSHTDLSNTAAPLTDRQLISNSDRQTDRELIF